MNNELGRDGVAPSLHPALLCWVGGVYLLLQLRLVDGSVEEDVACGPLHAVPFHLHAAGRLLVNVHGVR